MSSPTSGNVRSRKGKRFFCVHARKGLALPLKNRHNGCFLMACGNEKNVSKGYMALQMRSGDGPCQAHKYILYALKHGDTVADSDVDMTSH